MIKTALFWTAVILFLSSSFFLLVFFKEGEYENGVDQKANSERRDSAQRPVGRAEKKSGLSLNETGKMEESGNDFWWLNSGGVFFLDGENGKTNQGSLGEDDRWFQTYKKNNPRDTDGGMHPQNIFRLVSKAQHQNFTQQAHFRINKINPSYSAFRNGSNGILFFSRYQDGDNLYYAGIRTDGFAVIKKKIEGRYHTMAYERIIEGEYDRKKNPNLLPEKSWVGLKVETSNGSDGAVSIKVFWKNGQEEWQLIAQAKDDGRRYGGKSFLSEGYAGIRSDFMDMEFEGYRTERMRNYD